MMKKIILSILFTAVCISHLWAGDEPPTVESNKNLIDLVQSHADYVWTLVAAALVFFMQAGFALVESGFTRAKNAVNIMMKNLMDFSMGSLAFWAIGFGLMFGASSTGWFGTSGFFLSDFKVGGDPWVLAFWMFQVVFCATAATIVSGAMAEVFGSWAWGSLFNGSGWLEGLGFIDFAGSTVVHSVGGWAALAGAIVLGPRLGKYTKSGKIKPILGHSMPLAALGVFILWLGWFGFNPGSTTAANKDIAMIFVNTNLAAAAGAVLAMATSWIKFGKPEVGMSLNGALAGLVAITAPCASVTPLSAVIIGAAGGAPVGAISVHGVSGAWGTLAASIFNIGGTSAKIIGVQLLGIAACFLWVFPLAFLVFKLIDKTVGLRVSPEEELEGLDVTEHGGNAYPDFEVYAYGSMGSGGGSAAAAAAGSPTRVDLEPVKQT
jgi:Amt family ammonium transporter